jgi:hypothetical protein
LSTGNTNFTVAEISKEFGIPESVIANAIQSHELEVVESTSEGAKISDNAKLKEWVANHHPARIYAALSGTAEVPNDERMQLLANLPFLARQLVNADYAALTLSNQDGRIVDMIVSGMSESQSKPI